MQRTTTAADTEHAARPDMTSWARAERDLLERLRAGGDGVVNMRRRAHASLWKWAEQAGLAVRVDRRTKWGNPFTTPLRRHPRRGARQVRADLLAEAGEPARGGGLTEGEGARVLVRAGPLPRRPPGRRGRPVSATLAGITTPASRTNGDKIRSRATPDLEEVVIR